MKALFPPSSYPYALVWIPQKQILRQGFCYKYFIWEVILGNAGRGVGKWDREWMKEIKRVLSSQLPLWAAGTQFCWGALEHCKTCFSIVSPKGWGSWGIDTPNPHTSLMKDYSAVISCTSGMICFGLIVILWPEKNPNWRRISVCNKQPLGIEINVGGIWDGH